MRIHVSEIIDTELSAAQHDISAVPGEYSKTMAEVMSRVVQAQNCVSGLPAEDVLYAGHVCERISSLEVHSSQCTVSLCVESTCAGIAAMRQDPEYENWAMLMLQYDFAYEDPFGDCGGTDVVHFFGASRGAYSIECNTAGEKKVSSESTDAASGNRKLIWRRPAVKQPRTVRKDPYAAMRARLRVERMLRKIADERHRYETERLEFAALRRKELEEMHRTGRLLRDEQEPLPPVTGTMLLRVGCLMGD